MLHFAYPFPWWLALVLAFGAGALTFLEYRRPLVPLKRAQLVALAALRLVALVAIVLFLFRPVVLLPPSATPGATVPIIVDVSRSMRVADASGRPRVVRAAEIVRTELVPGLSQRFNPELYTAGESLATGSVEHLSADAPQSNLTAALDTIVQRHRGERIAGIVLLSDGADTSGKPDREPVSSDVPVFTIGIGSSEGIRDREVLGITAGELRLDQTSVDLHVTAISTGFGRTPFQLRLLADGRTIDSRRIVPETDGAPVDEIFTVSPNPLNPTVYTAQIAAEEGESVVENNARSVLVNPASRKRRVLMIEGAPGFEHSFVKRAWAQDTGLEVDSVVRKGRNAEGRDTFVVQAAGGRSSALSTGFPARREDLFAYDALVLANIEGDVLTREQLAMAADFVAGRGGGLLVLGGRSFAAHGLMGTPLEYALPVELNDRRGRLVWTGIGDSRLPAEPNKLVVTAEGENHPIMRIADSSDETRKRWAALPALASSAPLGGPRPAATVLAVTMAPSGSIFPVVAVQRYGQGRSMIFAGEASWRWRMLLASTDRTHERFWRQAIRWVAASASDPVALTVPDATQAGDGLSIDVDARDQAFAPVPDATVDVSVTAPGGDPRPLKVRGDQASSGRFSATFRPEQTGLYRVHTEARHGTTMLGIADRWLYVGGADREFVDPRLNEGFLRRVARRSGGRYVAGSDASRVVSWMQSGLPRNAPPERRDLWHEPWAFALIIGLLSMEWILRRRWGLR